MDLLKQEELKKSVPKSFNDDIIREIGDKEFQRGGNCNPCQKPTPQPKTKQCDTKQKKQKNRKHKTVFYLKCNTILFKIEKPQMFLLQKTHSPKGIGYPPLMAPFDQSRPQGQHLPWHEVAPGMPYTPFQGAESKLSNLGNLL